MSDDTLNPYRSSQAEQSPANRTLWLIIGLLAILLAVTFTFAFVSHAQAQRAEAMMEAAQAAEMAAREQAEQLKQQQTP